MHRLRNQNPRVPSNFFVNQHLVTKKLFTKSPFFYDMSLLYIEYDFILPRFPPDKYCGTIWEDSQPPNDPVLVEADLAILIA